MKRTADRPMAAGRFTLAQGVMAGLAALALGACWLALTTNPLTVALALLTAFTTWPSTRRSSAYRPGNFHRRVSWRHGSAAWLDRRARAHRVAGCGVCSPSYSSGSFPTSWRLRVVSRRLCPRRNPHVARRSADGWSTVGEALFFAVAMIL